MGISRHDKIDMFLSQIEKRCLQFLERHRRLLDLLFDVKSQIKRDLIVAAPRSVEFGARLADPVSQRALDIHVQIFGCFVPLKFSGFDLLFNFAQPALDFLLFRT